MKVKQTMKRLLACTLAVAMLMTLPVATTAQAKVKNSLPEKVRIYTGDTPWSNSVDLSLADKDKSIANVKSNSKNLKVALTGYNKNISNGDVSNNSFTIGMLAFKSGKYTISYDIVKNKKVVLKKKIAVYAYPYPIKSVTVDGKDNSNYGTKTKAKIKVTLTSGNTLKKLEVGTYQIKTDKESGRKSSEMTYKTFKNGATVKLGTTNYYNKSQSGDRLKDDYFSGNLSSSLTTYTQIKITYKDKYTKQLETVYRGLNGLAK